MRSFVVPGTSSHRQCAAVMTRSAATSAPEHPGRRTSAPLFAGATGRPPTTACAAGHRVAAPTSTAIRQTGRREVLTGAYNPPPAERSHRGLDEAYTTLYTA